MTVCCLAMLGQCQASCRSLLVSPSTSSSRPSHKPRAFSVQQSCIRTVAFARRCRPQHQSCRTPVSCTAQQQDKESPVTPEILEDEDEDTSSLPAVAQRADIEPSTSQSGSQQLASFALGSQHKGVTTLLGFAGVALAGIAGECTCDTTHWCISLHSLCERLP